MKVIVFKTNVKEDKLSIEVPTEFIGADITVKVSFKKIRKKNDLKYTMQKKLDRNKKLDEIFEKIIEKNIKAENFLEDTPDWQK